MKATIEFDLPADLDAYQDAVNGGKWKELVRVTYFVLMVWRDIEANRQHQEIYDRVLKWYRCQIQDEGLTLASVQTLKQSRSKQMKFWSKQLDDCIKKSGVPEMMAEFEKEHRINLCRSVHAGSTQMQKKNPRKKEANNK